MKDMANRCLDMLFASLIVSSIGEETRAIITSQSKRDMEEN